MMSEQLLDPSLLPYQILQNPLINKETAFTQEERDQFGLNGLLPMHVSSPEEQILRCYQNFHRETTPLNQYRFLLGLLGRNELLFFQFFSRYVTELLPIIYTPTVGEAAIHYSQIYFRQGLYLSYPFKDQLGQILDAYSLKKNVQAIVVTDGERILGLGDQGIGGITIPVGKLALYTLFGGIHPSNTLPILLDVGTNNPALLQDPLYLGWRHERLSGSQYDEFIDCFVKAIQKRYPHVLLQWEDFGKHNARRLLDRYRQQILSFNDDIQGTASVTLGALLAAIQVTKQKLSEQRIAILGGGSAGVGIADALILSMRQQGLSQEEACLRIYIVDVDGLIHFNSAQISDAQRPYVKPQSAMLDWRIENPTHISLMDVVKNVHPTVLVGVSTQGGAFTKELIEEMHRHVARPIVFPLSNPISQAECTPQDLIEWTRGQGIIATGSPFQPVEYEGKKYHIGQCNNVYIFPGVGAGAIASQASFVSDEMFLEASKILASCSPAIKDPAASLFPPISEVRHVTRQIAIAVAKKAVLEKASALSISEIEKRVDALRWEPHYPIYTHSKSR